MSAVKFLASVSFNSMTIPQVDVVIDLNAFTTKYMKHSTDLFKTINVGMILLDHLKFQNLGVRPNKPFISCQFTAERNGNG